MSRCVMCGQRATGVIAYVGPICSLSCKEKIEVTEEEHRLAVLREDMWMSPPEMDLIAFEKFIFKLAVHFIEKAPEEVKVKWRRETPHMTKPFIVFMELKSRVIKSIPLMYVSAMQTEEHPASGLSTGVFQFKKKVPKGVVMDALVRSGFIAKRPDTGDPK